MGGCGKPAASQAEANGGGARPAWNSFRFDSQPQRRSEIFKRGKLSKEEALNRLDCQLREKGEADYLARIQDADGGFYFLLYPRAGAPHRSRGGCAPPSA